MSDRRFYVTTPIYYVNDAPHVGHAYTTTIADALARWHRLVGDDTYFLTGTDEFGLKVAQSAVEAGVTPQEQADRNAARFQQTWDDLDISYDDFIRTTEPRHEAAVQALLTKIKDNGDIELDTYEGPYCVSCEAYYAESELIDGTYCPIHTGKPVIRLKEENYFFRLSRYQQRLLDWIEGDPEAITPEGKRNEVLGFIRQGLDDVSITRTSLSLGGARALGRGARLLRLVRRPHQLRHRHRLRHRQREVRRDGGRTSTTSSARRSSASTASTGPPCCWLQGSSHRIASMSTGGCCSAARSCRRPSTVPPSSPTSRPARLVDDFGVDGFRYHFLRDAPFGPDGDFSYERMVDRYNADLANNFGNLVSRVATVVAKKCDGIGPAPRADSPLAAVAAEVLEATTRAWEDVQPSVALDAHLALDPRDQRAAGGQRAVEARPRT